MSPSNQIFAFCHVPKTGGQTLRMLLRLVYGVNHLDVMHRNAEVPEYTPANLRLDNRILPGLKSIAGHALKPFVDFQEYDDRLAWYTMLRDPTHRFISHYQHEIEIGGKSMSIREWAKQYKRHDWQVRMFAGEEDLEAAKQILQEKFVAVGLQEHFNESLKLFFQTLEIPEFPVEHQPVKNRSGSKLKNELHSQLDELQDLILENNSLDFQLYNFVKSEIWPKQQAKLSHDYVFADSQLVRRKWNLLTNFLYRNIVYKTYAKIGSYRIMIKKAQIESS